MVLVFYWNQTVLWIISSLSLSLVWINTYFTCLICYSAARSSRIRLLISLTMFDSETPPLPDTGQWFLLALNEKLPHAVVEILRARIIGLHHFLMLFMMLAFSVLFDSVKAPGLGLGARYMFTMGIGRLLRAITFVSTILPSARPWCANSRFRVPAYPHHWAQKYYVPYAADANAIRQIIRDDIAYGNY